MSRSSPRGRARFGASIPQLLWRVFFRHASLAQRPPARVFFPLHRRKRELSGGGRDIWQRQCAGSLRSCRRGEQDARLIARTRFVTGMPTTDTQFTGDLPLDSLAPDPVRYRCEIRWDFSARLYRRCDQCPSAPCPVGRHFRSRASAIDLSWWQAVLSEYTDREKETIERRKNPLTIYRGSKQKNGNKD